jgi:hypothetical protein
MDRNNILVNQWEKEKDAYVAMYHAAPTQFEQWV